MQRIGAFSFAIIGSLLIVIAGLVHALKQHPRYAPQVGPQQQAHGALKGEEHAKDREPNATQANEVSGGKETHQSEEEGTEFWPPLLGVRLKITDSLLAIFTGGLLIFTGLLWRSTDKLWKSTEEGLRQTQRAVMALSSWINDPVIREADAQPYIISVNQGAPAAQKVKVVLGYFFSVDWKNFGPTVAEHCEAGVMAVFVEDMDAESVPLPEGIIHRGNNVTVGPQGGFGSTTNINMDALVKARDKKIRIFLIGRIEYFDVFGLSHHTQVFNELLVYGHPENAMTDRSGPRIFQYPIWPEHNSSS